MFSIHGTRYGTSLSYECKTGFAFMVSGTPKRKLKMECQWNETWTGDVYEALPTCERVGCGDPPLPDEDTIENVVVNGYDPAEPILFNHRVWFT